MKIKTLVLVVCFASLVGCLGSDEEEDGGNGNNGGATPTQSEINALAGNITETTQDQAEGQGSSEGSECTTICSELEELGEAIASEGSTLECGGGGTVTVSVGSCNSSGTVSATLTLDNCDDGAGNVTDGSLTLAFTIDANEMSVVATSNSLEINDFNFSTDDVTVTVPCEGGMTGEATCSGTVSAGSASCEVASDCSGCDL